jgi:tetratricopeptide (TPR) repeat protein
MKLSDKARCDICKRDVLDASFLHLERQPFTRRQFSYCSRCRRRRGRKLLAIFALYCIAGLLVAGVGSVLIPSDPVFRIILAGLLNLCLVVAFAFLLLWPHEAAHALMAWILGLRVFRICIGRGRVLLTWRCFGIPWEVRSWPDRGLTHVGIPTLRFSRLRTFLMVLAGPLLHVLLLALCWGWLMAHVPWQNLAATIPGVVSLFLMVDLLVANAIILAVNLFPFRLRFGDERFASDGLQLCTIPFQSRQAIRARHAAAYFALSGLECMRAKQWQEAIGWCQRGLGQCPADFANRFLLGTAFLGSKQFEAARQHYDALWQQADLNPVSKALVADAIATTILFSLPLLLQSERGGENSGKQAHESAANTVRSLVIQEALGYCDSAFQLLAQLPKSTRLSFYGTKGALLIEEGSVDEGVAILEQLLEEADEPHVSAVCHSYLALTAARQGDLETGRQHISQAEALETDCIVLERVRCEWPEMR